MTAQKLATIQTTRVPANDVAREGPVPPLDKRAKARGKAAVGAFQKDTEAIQNAPDPFLARITLHLLALFVIGMIAGPPSPTSTRSSPPRARSSRPKPTSWSSRWKWR
ncbi:hypothetical protein ABMY26_35955 (plasmid) [Azospirillum sp. HJ39]|uniref:hypothetical protein n=1 Tax=Azospirillum sp. HJ39 TaxID=3159496 RepID=UPI003558CDCC